MSKREVDQVETFITSVLEIAHSVFNKYDLTSDALLYRAAVTHNAITCGHFTKIANALPDDSLKPYTLAQMFVIHKDYCQRLKNHSVELQIVSSIEI